MSHFISFIYIVLVQQFDPILTGQAFADVVICPNPSHEASLRRTVGRHIATGNDYPAVMSVAGLVAAPVSPHGVSLKSDHVAPSSSETIMSE